MIETADEKPDESPLQILLRGAFLIQELTKHLEKLKEPDSNREDIEDAATGAK